MSWTTAIIIASPIFFFGILSITPFQIFPLHMPWYFAIFTTILFGLLVLVLKAIHDWNN